MWEDNLTGIGRDTRKISAPVSDEWSSRHKQIIDSIESDELLSAKRRSEAYIGNERPYDTLPIGNDHSSSEMG